MKFHYAGKFNGDENSLPQRKHEKGYVPFKEPKDMKKFTTFMTIASMVLGFMLLGVVYWLNGKLLFLSSNSMIPFAIGILCLVPHEFLHAICFKEDVYMYTNLIKGGMLFVVGKEDMSKTRFCFMSLLPNIILGIIPFIIYMINPTLEILGEVAIISIAAGVGDYLNVYNALTQMPKDAKTYLSGMHSYWYLPEKR